MQIHQIKPKHSPIKSQRRGRGGKRGTYSGRGMKGQKSRAGSKIRPQIREAILKFPKRRGVKFQRLVNKVTIIDINKIITAFPEGGIISPQTLKKRGLITKSSRFAQIKIIGNSEVHKPYTLQGVTASRVARDNILKAKGKIILAKINKSQDSKDNKIAKKDNKKK